MAFSVNTPVGDGVTKQFSVSFTNGIFSRDNVFVFVDGELDVGGEPLARPFTWINDGLIELTGTAPAAGVVVRIRRIMDKTQPVVDYVDGSILSEKNMDESLDHLLNTMHEVLDGYGFGDIQTDINMNGNVIRNTQTDLNDPTSLVTVSGLGDAVDRSETAADEAEAALAATIADNDSTVAELNVIKGDAEAAETAAENSANAAAASAATAADVSLIYALVL